MRPVHSHRLTLAPEARTHNKTTYIKPRFHTSSRSRPIPARHVPRAASPVRSRCTPYTAHRVHPPPCPRLRTRCTAPFAAHGASSRACVARSHAPCLAFTHPLSHAAAHPSAAGCTRPWRRLLLGSTPRRPPFFLPSFGPPFRAVHALCAPSRDSLFLFIYRYYPHQCMHRSDSDMEMNRNQ